MSGTGIHQFQLPDDQKFFNLWCIFNLQGNALCICSFWMGSFQKLMHLYPQCGEVLLFGTHQALGSKKTQETHTKMSSQELMETLDIFIGQLRQLFGLKPNYRAHGMDVATKFLVSEKGFAQWELDLLYRHHACSNLLSCLTTLESLSSLVQSLPRMIVMDEIGKQVELSLEAASLAQRNATLGISDSSAVSATRARALAEDAFFSSICYVNQLCFSGALLCNLHAILRTSFFACYVGRNQRVETL